MFCHDYKFSHFSFYIKMILKYFILFFSYFLCALPLLRVSQVCLEKSKSCRCHFRSKILHLLHDYSCFSFFLYGVLYQRQLCFKCFPFLYFCNLKFMFFDIIYILILIYLYTFSQILFLWGFLYVFLRYINSARNENAENKLKLVVTRFNKNLNQWAKSALNPSQRHVTPATGRLQVASPSNFPNPVRTQIPTCDCTRREMDIQQ